MRLQRELFVSAYLALKVEEEEGRSHDVVDALPVGTRMWWFEMRDPTIQEAATCSNVRDNLELFVIVVQGKYDQLSQA